MVSVAFTWLLPTVVCLITNYLCKLIFNNLKVKNINIKPVDRFAVVVVGLLVLDWNWNCPLLAIAIVVNICTEDSTVSSSLFLIVVAVTVISVVVVEVVSLMVIAVGVVNNWKLMFNDDWIEDVNCELAKFVYWCPELFNGNIGALVVPM